MPKREIEGDWLLGWPDRKRVELPAQALRLDRAD